MFAAPSSASTHSPESERVGRWVRCVSPGMRPLWQKSYAVRLFAKSPSVAQRVNESSAVDQRGPVPTVSSSQLLRGPMLPMRCTSRTASLLSRVNCSRSAAVMQVFVTNLEPIWASRLQYTVVSPRVSGL